MVNIFYPIVLLTAKILETSNQSLSANPMEQKVLSNISIFSVEEKDTCEVAGIHKFYSGHSTGGKYQNRCRFTAYTSPTMIMDGKILVHLMIG
jgi:hypothetical protein